MKRSTYLTSTRIQAVADQLKFVDWEVIETLSKVRLAQGRQLQRLHFTDGSPVAQARSCRRRLQQLVGLGVLRRLDRNIGGVRAGSSAFLYALDIGGLKLAERLGRAATRRSQRPFTPGVAFVRHRLAVTQLYVDLVEADRAGALELLQFVAEPDCWRSFLGPGGTPAWCKPDALVEVGQGPYIDSYFIEIDLATESSTALARKCDAYRAYWASGREQARSGDAFPHVFFLVPTEARKATVVDVLSTQPAESWKLFRVGLIEDAPAALADGGEE